MKPGKVTQTVWRRNVGRELHIKKAQDVFTPSGEQKYSVLEGRGRSFLSCAQAQAYGRTGRVGYYAALEAAGHVAAAGYMPEALSATVLMPPEEEEGTLRAAVQGLRDAAEEMGLHIAGVQAEVIPSVICITVVVQAVGTAAESPGIWVGGARPGQEILLCGYTGLEGMLRIMEEEEEELSKRFVPSFLAGAKALKRALVMPDTIWKVCAGNGTGGQRDMVSAVQQIGSGGIFAALWELAEASNVGVEADLASMALKQETVEICEFFQLNPYQMTSAGSFLLVTDCAEDVLDILKGAGARAGRLGVVKAQNVRTVTSGEEIRYLEKPAPDELARWQAARTAVE